MFLHRLFTFLALGSLLAVTCAHADVRTPYQLDPSFNGTGYRDWDSTLERTEGAARLTFDGDFTITARRILDDDDFHHIRLHRFDRNGQRVNWSGIGALDYYVSPPADNDIVVVRDVLAAPDRGRLFVLADIRKTINNPYGIVQTAVWDIPLNGSGSGMIYYPGTLAYTNNVGVRLAHRDNRVFALFDNRILPGQNEMVVAKGSKIHIHALKIGDHSDIGGGWDESWGNNSYMGYEHKYNLYVDDDPGAGCTPATPCIYGPYEHSIQASQFEIADNGWMYVAGSLNAPGDPFFILKLRSTGAVEINPTDWVANDPSLNPGFLIGGEVGNTDRPAGLVLRPNSNIYDIFLLSSFQRPCGEGLIVYAFNRNGTLQNPHRTWTHGGGDGSAGLACDSILARDMTLIPGQADGSGARLAIVGEYLSKKDVISGAPQAHAAMLLTLNPDNLRPSPTESVQEILGGGPWQEPYDPLYWFNAVRYHPTQKRLLAVGGREQEDQWDTTFYATVARLMEQPLFSDGFEGN